MEILNDEVIYLIDKLNENGFEAYVVGGAVRDYLLKREINDIDLTTSAKPDDIQRIFSCDKTLDLGKKYGTIKVRVKEDGNFYEITTFRTEKNYDGRKPREVKFSKSLEDDLTRRDFTINAMCMDKKGNIYDFFLGREDLRDKIIRVIGDANLRFSEDYLRLIRGVRFATELNFTIEDESKKAIKAYASNLEKISAERIRAEFDKILLSDYPSLGMNLLLRTGLLTYIFPELVKMAGFDQKNPFHKYDLWTHTMRTLEGMPRDLELRLSSLFHDIGKIYTQTIKSDGTASYYNHAKISAEICNKSLKRLKYPNRTVEAVCMLVNMHMDSMNKYSEKRVKRLLNKLGEERLKKLFQLHKSDIRAMGSNDERLFENLNDGYKIMDEILLKGDLFEKGKLAINGRDIIDLGFSQGKIIGIILEDISNRVLDGDIPNEKKFLIDYINERYKKWIK